MRALVVARAPEGWGDPDWSAKCLAQAIEARRAATAKTGAVHESAVPERNASND